MPDTHPKPVKISFVNVLDAVVVAQFEALPVQDRLEAVQRAQEEYWAAMKYVETTAQLGVSPQFFSLMRATPQWSGWPQALECAATSNRAPPEVKEAWARMQAVGFARALEEAWSTSSSSTASSKPRF